jgi:hypothetical protein
MLHSMSHGVADSTGNSFDINGSGLQHMQHGKAALEGGKSSLSH